MTPALVFICLGQRISAAWLNLASARTHEIRDAGDVAGSRYREILAYLGDSGADWLAIDDDALLFPPGCAELILCADGFKYAEEIALRTALEKFEADHEHD